MTRLPEPRPHEAAGARAVARGYRRACGCGRTGSLPAVAARAALALLRCRTRLVNRQPHEALGGQPPLDRFEADTRTLRFPEGDAELAATHRGFRRFLRSSRLPASAPMVTALTNNSARASAVSFGKGTCVLTHQNRLASAIRHVASRPTSLIQSRSAPTDARNRSRSGGSVGRVAMPRWWVRAAPRVELRMPRREPRWSRPLSSGARSRARSRSSPRVVSLRSGAALRVPLRSQVEAELSGERALDATAVLPRFERVLDSVRRDFGDLVERVLGALMGATAGGPPSQWRRRATPRR